LIGFWQYETSKIAPLFLEADFSSPLLFLTTISLLLSACATLPRASFTEQEQAIAEIPGMPGVRFFSDAPWHEIVRKLDGGGIRQAAHRLSGFDMLAVSGGASNGAFGAGIINGWTRSGGRPKFVIVTGVSAGSLIAPFAFLGPKYDAQLKDAFVAGAAEPIGDGSDSNFFYNRRTHATT
jgi:hypothetical protein